MEYVPAKFENPPKIRPKKKPTPAKLKQRAMELSKYLSRNELFGDARIYVRTSTIKKNEWLTIQAEPSYKQDAEWKPWSFESRGRKYTFYTRTDLDPKSYLDYSGSYLSMSFEGPLYEALNYGYTREYCYLKDVEEHLTNFFAHYGLHLELGNAWNFSLYE